MSSGTVAVIDDDEAVGKALRRLLSSMGFRALVYCSAADFLASASGACVACVVADIHMPGMTGFELQQALHEAGWRVPVILMTGHEGEDLEATGLQSGALALLRKPFPDAELLEAVSRAIESQPS